MSYGMAAEPLRRELSCFYENKQSWLIAHPNEFAVISGNRVEGFHPDFESAFNAGLKAFGLFQPFLIKQISETDPVHTIY